MTASEGFKPSVELRETIQVSERAKNARRDAKADIANKEAGLVLLAQLPAEVADNPEALRVHIAKSAGDPGKPKPKGKVKLSEEDKKKEEAELVWKTLQKQADGRSMDRETLADEIKAELPALREAMVELDADTNAKIDAAVDAKKKYAAYVALVPENVLKLKFEKDRSKAAPRAIEEDLALLKAQLAKFKDEPVDAVAPCPARAALVAFVQELEQEVDHAAHRAKCNLCKTENGLPRTEDAKALIRAKVMQLETLARADSAGPSAAEQADFALAKALDAMRKTPGEDGKKGGKMLGVLVCTNQADQTVLLYGYSGTLFSNSRVIYGEMAVLKAKRTIPDKIAAKAADLEKKATELADKKVAVADLEKVVAKQKAEAEAAAEKAAAEKAAAELEAAELAAAEKAVAEKAVAEKAAVEIVVAEDAAGDIVDAENPAAEVVVAEKVVETPEAACLTKEKKTLERIEKEHAALKKAHEELQAARLLPEVIDERLTAAEAALIDAGLLDTVAETATGAGWARPIASDGALTSVGGASQSLAALAVDHDGTPHGVCSAPKMIQAATAQGLKIVSMAEAWFGEGANTHGELVASCATCMKNIGFQLCENCHA